MTIHVGEIYKFIASGNEVKIIEVDTIKRICRVRYTYLSDGRLLSDGVHKFPINTILRSAKRIKIGFKLDDRFKEL